MGRISIFVFFIVALFAVSASAQSVSTAPPLRPQLTAPGPQKHGPPSRPQNSNQGVLAGYIFWAVNGEKLVVPTSCGGLTVTVSVATPSTQPSPFEQFKTLGTYNNFTFMESGSALAVCAYSIKQLPIGQDLRVQVGVDSSIFHQLAASTPPAAGNPSGAIKIPGGMCNKFAPAVPSPSVLNSSWWTCGIYAHNVNFILQPSTSMHLMSATGNAPLLAQRSAPGIQAQVSPGLTAGTPGQLLPARPGQRPSLTNADVIKMVRGGVPESAILSSIRSGQPNFDLSPNGCRSLQQARVSQNVLRAMGNGGVPPCSGSAIAGGGSGASTVELNPQPFPPGTRTLQGAGSGPSSLLGPSNRTAASDQHGKTLQSKLTLKLGPKVRVSDVARRGIDVATIQALQQQSLYTHNVKVGPTHTLSGTDPATGGSVPGGDPAGGSQPGGSSSGTPLQTAGTPSLQATTGSSQNSLKQRMTMAPQPISMCRFTTNPVIETVAGKQHSIVMTPDPGTGKYPANQYAIVGCNFGTVPGDVHIFGAFLNNPSPVKLGIDSWSDSAILVTFNPVFQNEYDTGNISLVVVRKDGKSVQIPGISFVATRVSRSLARIPHSIVKLPKDYLQQNVYVSPVTYANLQSAHLSPTTQTASAVFYIYDPIWSSNVGDGYPQERLSFSDSIDFGKLRSGFVLDDDIQTLIVSGPASFLDSMSIGVGGGSCKFYDAALSPTMQSSNLLLGVKPAECDNSGKFIYAYYGLALSVTGPKGDKLDPWPDGLQ